MKKFFLIVTASVFCVTSFAETVQQDSESIEASAEFMSPSESMGPNDDGNMKNSRQIIYHLDSTNLSNYTNDEIEYMLMAY